MIKDKMNGINVFQYPKIMEILGQSCSMSDKETLKGLRELSTSYYDRLQKPYFDLVQLQIKVDMHKKKLIKSFPSRFKRNLKLQDWDPQIAHTIRVLEFNVEHNEEYLDITPSESKNMDNYHLMLNQLLPYVTKLKLAKVHQDLNLTKLLNFIQQFTILKNISLEIQSKKVYEEDLNDFKSVLSTLKSSGLIVELRLREMNVDCLETVLAPENGLINLIHRLGFENLHIEDDKLQRFARIVTENRSIISDIHFWFGVWDWDHRLHLEDNRNIFFQHLRVISPFVSTLKLVNGIRRFDVLSSVPWPSLVKLRIQSYGEQLPDLSISCPKLHKLIVWNIEEDEVFFSNNELTQEQALENIFSGCAKSLKQLTIRSRGIKIIIPNGHLHNYLQQLLPLTKIDLE